MENRVRELEKTASDVRERLVKIETRLEHVATTASVEKIAGELNAKLEIQSTKIEAVRGDLIRWFVATTTILAGLAFTAARYIH
jgi:predicted component of type VI protein secretion system